MDYRVCVEGHVRFSVEATDVAAYATEILRERLGDDSLFPVPFSAGEPLLGIDGDPWAEINPELLVLDGRACDVPGELYFTVDAETEESALVVAARRLQVESNGIYGISFPLPGAVGREACFIWGEMPEIFLPD